MYIQYKIIVSGFVGETGVNERGIVVIKSR